MPMVVPGPCPQCGSPQLLYDEASNAVGCPKCGLIVPLGDQRPGGGPSHGGGAPRRGKGVTTFLLGTLSLLAITLLLNWTWTSFIIMETAWLLMYLYILNK